MKKVILSIVMAISGISIKMSAQVGIQTSNPQGVFNIDAAKDNPATGVPTAAQQANDIVVTATGSMGVGTTSPSVKLDVQGSQLLNAAITGSATKNALDINVGQDAYTYGNRLDNFGINMKSSSSLFPGTISRINFGDISTGTAVGPRYLSFSVGITPNELMYLTDANAGRVGIGTTTPSVKLDVQGSQLLNAAITGTATKNALDINVGQDSYTYGNRLDNFGINMKSSSSLFPGIISRINFGDVSTGTAVGPRYLSFSVGITPNELMYLTDGNAGRVGIGTITPATRLHVEGAEVRLSNGASAWGLDPEGTSPTSQFSIVDRTSNVRRLVLLENGNAFMGGTLGTNGGNATISAIGGSVGINNIATPTNTLDVNGTTRVRTIPQVAGSNAVTPVYSDANGVLSKASVSSTYGSVISNTVSVASGATAAFITTGMVDGAIYKAVVASGDACAYAIVAEYYVFNIAANSNFSIRGISGLISNSTTNTKGPTFNEIDKNTTATSWTGKPTCADTGNTTALNFTLSMPSGNQINVKNDGNITRSYTIVLTRLT